MKTKSFLLYTLFLCCSYFSSCEDYLDVDAPFGQLPSNQIFEDKSTATAAVTTLYSKMRDEVLISGGQTGLSYLMGLYTDELENYSLNHSPQTFYNHQIIASNTMVNNLWSNSYNLIYMSNSILEGLEKSQNIPQEIKSQLMGEALFARALMHFYLVNLFGDCPYITETDYQKNSKIYKSSESDIYSNIIKDLKEAFALLSDSYITHERTRPNKWVASSLLSRIYLYLEQWENAENESTQIINNTSLYTFQESIDEVFLKDSPSTIWHLKPKNEGDNTLEGQWYIFESGPPQIATLNLKLIEDMEDEDLRKQYWIGEVSDGTNVWYFPYKYKQRNNTGISLEYSVVFRLAEQYLIRAEAKAKLGDILGAQADINIVRTRAGLEQITFTTSESILDAIIMERRFEFFTEHGHRWFDLRRTGMAEQILAPIKIGWTSTNILLPIPEEEILMNPNLSPQNPGY